MSVFNTIKTYGRFGLGVGLRRFLRRKITLEEARTIVEQLIEEREANFLRLMEQGVFAHIRSPYLPLLKLAGCEMGDIHNMVRSRGLEETLRALREAGVYFSFEEFKGLEPTLRNGQVISVYPQDFDNPCLQPYYHGQSGGTTGAATRVSIDLDHMVAAAPFDMLTRHAHDILGVPTAIWLGGIPGLNVVLRSAMLSHIPQKWFTDSTSLNLHAATAYLVLMGRLFGVSFPWPEPVRWDEAVVIARWAAKTIKTNGACVIRTMVSKALRVCVAAQEEGIDLTGVTFLVTGEPPTLSKVQGITRTGARYVPFYAFTEHGACAGFGCAQPADENDIHFSKDALALIQFPRKVTGSESTVDAFNFTSLLPTAPKLLLNVEMDDYGLIETRSCGCPLESYGFTEHLYRIRSFRKLTGGGPTLVGSKMAYILEEVLPSRFGGSPLDYQLLEEEDENGFTRFSLVVNPKVQLSNETEVVETVLKALGKWQATQYHQAGMLRVRRMEPILTNRGKLLPIIPLDMARRIKSSSDT
jgi:hypothetical protein